MTGGLDQTHDPELTSWVASANDPGTDFPIQNLPFGVFRRRGGDFPRVGVAIGTRILDLHRTVEVGAFGLLEPALRSALLGHDLTQLMALGRSALSLVRAGLYVLLRSDSPVPRPPEDCLVPAEAADLLLPAAIGDYTDFYASIHHANNVGSMFRPDQPLLPNYKWVPIGYHGRASSIVASGTPIRRPCGQLQADPLPAPTMAPTGALDYECEVAAWVGVGNPLGTTIPLPAAEQHLVGLSLLNDWSARDIQRWEYQPLGPFLAKNFATTISPWVVTLDALEPFRVPAPPRPEGDPPALPYLNDPVNQARGGIAIDLTVELRTARMRADGLAAHQVSRASFADMYWTIAQLVAHHASNGCNLRPADLLASGTVSGSSKDSRGCLLELTWRGSEPLTLPNGEVRRFLEDGDEVVMRGRCNRDGFRAIGFGACSGGILPA